MSEVKDTFLWDTLEELRLWFEQNPKLPEKIDPLVLQRFLKCMYYDVEETKNLLEVHYALRNKHPNLFLNRDPADEAVKETLKATDLVILPGLTPDQYKVSVFRFTDPDPNKYNSIMECVIYLMVTDLLFTQPDAESGKDTGENAEDDNLANGDIQIFDMTHYSMAHAMRISFSTIRFFMKYVQEAHPVRLKAIHIIHCPAYLDKIVALVKPFIQEEVYKIMHFHTAGLDSLYEFVPRRMLPEEYGGKAGKMAELKAPLTEMLAQRRDYLMDSSYWRIAEDPKESRKRWFWF